jgi:hypothetical protein
MNKSDFQEKEERFINALRTLGVTSTHPEEFDYFSFYVTNWIEEAYDKGADVEFDPDDWFSRDDEIQWFQDNKHRFTALIQGLVLGIFDCFIDFRNGKVFYKYSYKLNSDCILEEAFFWE